MLSMSEHTRTAQGTIARAPATPKNGSAAGSGRRVTTSALVVADNSHNRLAVLIGQIRGGRSQLLEIHRDASRDPEPTQRKANCGRPNPTRNTCRLTRHNAQVLRPSPEPLRASSLATVDTARLLSAVAIERAERPARAPSAIATRSSSLRYLPDSTIGAAATTTGATNLVTPFRTTTPPFFHQ